MFYLKFFRSVLFACLVFVGLPFQAHSQLLALNEGEVELFKCDLIERVPVGPNQVEDGLDLGELQLLQREGREDLPFEVRFAFSNEASEAYDLIARDRFPSMLSVIQVSELVTVPDDNGVVPPLDPEAAAAKGVLDFFQLVAGVEVPEKVFAYLVFSDASGLSLSISYLDKDGQLLGQSGVVYGKIPYACQLE